MAASNDTKLGLAIQTNGSTVNETAAAFNYFTFAEGSMGVNNMVVPAEDGIGTGGFPSAVEKMGVFAQGGMEGVAHSKSLGMLLYGALGNKAVVADGAGYKHTFTVDATNKLVLPYFTVRQYNPTLSTSIGEVFPHSRLAGLALTWQAAQYLRMRCGLMGTLAGVGVDINPDDWAPTVDLGPTFISPKATVTGFPGVTVKVISGSLQMGAEIPLDNQWITGSYTPDAMDITRRNAVLQLVLKIDSMELYKKFSYDPAGTAVWAANIMKEGGVTLTFESSQTYDTNKYHKLVVKFDNVGENVAWSAQPLTIRAGQPVTLAITGTVMGSNASEITAELYNNVANYAATGFA